MAGGGGGGSADVKYSSVHPLGLQRDEAMIVCEVPWPTARWGNKIEVRKRFGLSLLIFLVLKSGFKSDFNIAPADPANESMTFVSFFKGAVSRYSVIFAVFSRGKMATVNASVADITP